MLANVLRSVLGFTRRLGLPFTATAPFCPSEVAGSVVMPRDAGFWSRLRLSLGPGLLVVTFALPRDATQRAAGPAAAAGGGPPGAQTRTVGRFDPRLRLVSLAALVAMSSVAVAQVTIGFFAIDRLGLDHQAGAGAAGLALTTVGLVQILSHQVIMRNPAVPASRWITAGALIAAVGFGGVALVTTQAQLMCGYGIAAFGIAIVLMGLGR